MNKWQLYVGYYHVLIMLFSRAVTIEDLSSPRAIFMFDCSREEALMRRINRNLDVIAQIWRMGEIGQLDNGDAVNVAVDRGRAVHNELIDLLMVAEIEGRVLYLRHENGDPVVVKDGCALLTILESCGAIHSTEIDRRWWIDMTGAFPNLVDRINNSYLYNYVNVVGA